MIRWFTLTTLAITSYTHKPWHRRYFFNRELPYWIQSSITGSAFRGFTLILQNNSMLKDTKKMFRSRIGGFSALIHTTRLAFVVVLGEGRFRCLLRSDYVSGAQQVRQNRLDDRTCCNSFSPEFHVSGYRAIGRLRTGKSYRVA